MLAIRDISKANFLPKNYKLTIKPYSAECTSDEVLRTFNSFYRHQTHPSWIGVLGELIKLLLSDVY